MKSRKIILLMTDSQRWDMCSCYADTGLKTPNIDSLAAQGVRFERAYTTQPVCQPARAGIFTGLYPHSCAGWANSMGLSDNVHTVGERLQDDGVHTAYVGKWHLDGSDYFGMGKCPKGWDARYWYDMRNYLEELTPQERQDSRNAQLMNTRDFSEDFTYAHRCSNRAIDFLQQAQQEDFFLVVSYDEPHGPSLCPPPYSSMYRDYAFPKRPNVRDTLQGKPDYQKVWAAQRTAEDKDALEIREPFFFGCNSFVDHEIGRVLEAAEQYAPDAIVFYTADHGDFLHSHSLWAKGPAVYDEITRIPLIVKGAQLPKGAVAPGAVSHISLTPTILELMGCRVPEIMEGKSIVQALENPEHAAPNDVFIEFGRYEVDHDGFGGFQPLRCIFDGRYKLSLNLLSQDELYDLQTDPDEMVNRVQDPACQAIRNALHDRLLQHMDDTRDPFRGYWWRQRPWRTEAPAPCWKNSGMTRQRVEEERYEKRQLDYHTGLPIEQAVRSK